MTKEKTTGELLEDYGYIAEGNVYTRPGRTSSDFYVKVAGAVDFPAAGAAAFGTGQPWGKETPIAGRVQVPFAQLEQYKEVSNLHPAQQPEMFEWIWPDERVREIFEHVAGVDKDGQMLDNPWVKTIGEDGKATYKKA
jgi:hypothetical protein